MRHSGALVSKMNTRRSAYWMLALGTDEITTLAGEGVVAHTLGPLSILHSSRTRGLA